MILESYVRFALAWRVLLEANMKKRGKDSKKLGFGRETVRTLTKPLTNDELAKVEGGRPMSNTEACNQPGDL